MKWCGLATSLRMSALGLNCGSAGRIPSRLVCETNLPEGRDRKIPIDLNQKTKTKRKHRDENTKNHCETAIL
jgi:hypothetical protein